MKEATKTVASDEEKKPRGTRDAAGRWVRGATGNPHGRPPISEEQREVRALCVVERAANVARLVQIRDNAADIWARIEAVRILLLYSDGKPQTLHVGAPLVAMQFNGVGAQGGQALSPQDAYRLMMTGAIEASGDHPAFHPVTEQQPVSTVDNAERPVK